MRHQQSLILGTFPPKSLTCRSRGAREAHDVRRNLSFQARNGSPMSSDVFGRAWGKETVTRARSAVGGIPAWSKQIITRITQCLCRRQREKRKLRGHNISIYKTNKNKIRTFLSTSSRLSCNGHGFRTYF